MATNVYLIGHGRVDNKGTQTPVPRGITMHWLGPLGDVTSGLAHGFLSGEHSQEERPDVSGTFILEHYLCADLDFWHEGKIKKFFGRNTPHPNQSEDPYILYPRDRINLPLSSIFAFLKMLSPTKEWHVYWTCCRGFIGVENQYMTQFKPDTGRQRLDRTQSGSSVEKTPGLDDQNHRTEDANFKNLVLIAKSDFERLQQFSSLEEINKLLGIAAARVAERKKDNLGSDEAQLGRFKGGAKPTSTPGKKSQAATWG